MYRLIKLISLVILIIIPSTYSYAVVGVGEILWGTATGGGGGGTASTTTFSPITGNAATEVQSAIANLQSTKANTSDQSAVLVANLGGITTTLNPNDADNNGTPTDTLACTSTTCFFQGSDRSLWVKISSTGFKQWERLDRPWRKPVYFIGSAVAGATENAAPLGTSCLRWWDPSRSVQPQNCNSRSNDIELNRTTIITGYRVMLSTGNVAALEGAKFSISTCVGNPAVCSQTGNFNVPDTNALGPADGVAYERGLATPLVLTQDTYKIQPSNGDFCQTGDGGAGTSTPSTDCVFNGLFGWGEIELIGYQIQ